MRLWNSYKSRWCSKTQFHKTYGRKDCRTKQRQSQVAIIINEHKPSSKEKRCSNIKNQDNQPKNKSWFTQTRTMPIFILIVLSLRYAKSWIQPISPIFSSSSFMARLAHTSIFHFIFLTYTNINNLNNWMFNGLKRVFSHLKVFI